MLVSATIKAIRPIAMATKVKMALSLSLIILAIPVKKDAIPAIPAEKSVPDKRGLLKKVSPPRCPEERRIQNMPISMPPAMISQTDRLPRLVVGLK